MAGVCSASGGKGLNLKPLNTLYSFSKASGEKDRPTNPTEYLAYSWSVAVQVGEWVKPFVLFESKWREGQATEWLECAVQVGEKG